MFKGFWDKIVKPIVGLSPMDGVTDAACRYIMAKYGQPDVVFTEFTHAQGLIMAPKRLLRDFEYSEMERPVVAQIYGHRPEDFYKATHVVCELGFDGVDINMGCPARKVVSRNCGAGLIREPALALEIIRAVRQAIADWTGGQRLSELKLSQELIDGVTHLNEKRSGSDSVTTRRLIPYSIKTRLGYDEVVVEAWVEKLLQESPAAISIHGRTLKQMYRGAADWNAIARAVPIAQGTETLILGNGDIADLQVAAERILKTGVDGVLLGRNTIGNPWVFCDKAQLKASVQAGTVPRLSATKASWQERFAMALEHARTLESLRRPNEYKGIRKHLSGYFRGFQDASSLRVKCMQANSADELEDLLNRSAAAQIQRSFDPSHEAAG